MKKNFVVDENYINTRLDRWFKKKICDIPQSLFEKNIRKGNIRVNNKRTKSSYKLQKKDEILVKNFTFVHNKNKKQITEYKATKKEIRSSSSMFIENNSDFVVINKPPGISVQSGTKSLRNVIDILKDTKEFYDSFPYPVHRIDKETSGILIVAKNRKYAQLFTSLFRIRKIHKTYIGVVIGTPTNKNGTFVDKLFYYEGKKKYDLIATTHYSVIDTNNNYSLLKLNPKTGRKHQLRKQLLLHGHPILGDTKYALYKKSYGQKKNLMLHAYKIHFSIAGKRYNFTAELPVVFKKVLKEKYLKIY